MRETAPGRTTLATPFGTTPGARVCVRRWLLAFTAFTLIAGGPMTCRAADATLDTTRLPRLEGARELFAFPQTTGYIAGGSVAQAAEAAGKLLTADGWVEYSVYAAAAEHPDLDAREFRKGPLALTVTVQRAPAQGNATTVSYTVSVAVDRDPPSPKRASAATAPATATPTAQSKPVDNAIVDVSRLPRLDGAKENVTRSSTNQLSYTVAGSVSSAVAATKKLLAADGWRQYESPAEKPNPTSMSFQKGPQGLTVFFTMAGGQTTQSSVNYIPIRLNYALPLPEDASDIVLDGNRPYLSLVTAGTIDATRDFFQKEFGASGWSPLTATDAAARWPSASLEETLENGARAYYISKDRRPVLLSLQRRTDGKIKVEIKVPPFAEPQDLAAQEMSGLPVPTPAKSASSQAGETRRDLTALVPAEVGTVLAFYRRELAQRNWKEEGKGAVLNPEEVALTFSSVEGTATLKLGHTYDLTTVSLVVTVPPEVAAAMAAARAKANKEASDKFNREAEEHFRATVAEDAKRAAAAAQAARGLEAALHAPAKTQDLEADEDSGLPVPKQHTLSAPSAWTMPGGQSPFRRELEASVPADLGAVLAFYRRELAKREWKETAQRAVLKPDRVSLSFSSPEGPAVLKLGRQGGATTVDLALKIPAAAAQAGVLPAPGRVMLMFGNLGETEAAITINAKTIKIAAGVGGPETPKGPTLELAPGKYKYSLQIAGRPVRMSEITVGADDTWGLMVAPGGNAVMPLQMY